MRKVWLLACVLGLVAAAAWAQQDDRRPMPPPPPQEQTDDLEEIVWDEILSDGPDDRREPERPGDRRMGPPRGPMQGGRTGPQEGAEWRGRERRQGQPGGQPMREFEERAMNFLREFDIQEYVEFQELRGENPREYMRRLREVAEWMKEVEQIKTEDPEQYDLMRKEGELLGRIYELEKQYDQAHKSTSDAKAPEDVRKEIEEAVGQLFDVKIEMREREVKELRAELNKHETALKEAKDRKPELVQRRVREILGEGEEVFDW